jgi:flagellar hook assembly protein FlgD
VYLTIYNILGQEIYNKIIENQQQGYHEITWDGKQFSSGLYFYQLKFTSSNKKTSITQTKRMMLIK